MLYLPCRNWKGTGLLGEADFITPLIRTSPWEQAMWELVLSPFPSHTVWLCSFSSANVCLMQNSFTAWRAGTAMLSCHIKGTGRVSWDPLQHMHPVAHLNLPGILPLPLFALSVPSLPAKVEGSRVLSAGFGAQFTTKCTLTTSACVAAQQERFAKWNSWWWAPTAIIYTSEGSYFHFWLGPLAPSVQLAPWQLCDGNQHPGNADQETSNESTPLSYNEPLMRTASDFFFIIHEKDEFSTSSHVELLFFFFFSR